MKSKNNASRMTKKAMPKPSHFNEKEFSDSIDYLSDALQNDCVTLFNQGKSHKLAGKSKWSRAEFLFNHDELTPVIGIMDSLINLEYKFYCNGYDGRFEDSMKKCLCGYVMRDEASACPMCSNALYDVIRRYITPDLQMPTQSGFIPLDDYMSNLMHNGFGPAGKCALCEGNYVIGGYSPRPVIEDENARCCSRCDETIVITARGIAAAKSKKVPV